MVPPIQLTSEGTQHGNKMGSSYGFWLFDPSGVFFYCYYVDGLRSDFFEEFIVCIYLRVFLSSLYVHGFHCFLMSPPTQSVSIYNVPEDLVKVLG